MKVGGHLNLFDNKLASLPETMGVMRLGGNLSLHGNALTSLPESMGSLTVGRNLRLDNNFHGPNKWPDQGRLPQREGDVVRE